jgi:hypothetical protein
LKNRCKCAWFVVAKFGKSKFVNLGREYLILLGLQIETKQEKCPSERNSCSVVMKIATFYDTQNSLTLSQEFACGLYMKPVEFSSHLSYLFAVHLNLEL